MIDNPNAAPAANPFAPPEAHVADPALVVPDSVVLGGLASRLMAGTIDLGPAIALGAYIAWRRASEPEAGAGAAAELQLAMVALVGTLLLIVQAIVGMVMFHRTGQSIGKRLAGLRVVRVDGTRLPFARALALRWLVPFVLIKLPSWLLVAEDGLWAPTSSPIALRLAVGYGVFLLFHLPILFPGRRALHDRIAGSLVATAASTPDATLANSR